MSNTRLIRHIRNVPQTTAPILVLSKLCLCVMPIAEIAIGAVYLHDCPRKRYIPIYLIVVGVFSLVLALLSCLPCTHEPSDGPPNPLSRVCMTWNSLISLFLFAWFIAGSVWIYSIYKPNYDKNITVVDPYCDRTLYLFAFWITTVVYIVMAVSVVCGLCSLIFSGRSGRGSDEV